MVRDNRFSAHSAVYIALYDSAGSLLLHRRYNTGYADGRYDLPCGHVERDELLQQAAVRELREETGIKVKPEVLHLWHINQFAANGQHYYNFFFTADNWQGTPAIKEPDKCDDMGFFSIKNLPPLTAGSHVALQNYQPSGVTFGYIDQKLFDEIAGQN